MEVRTGSKEAIFRARHQVVISHVIEAKSRMKSGLRKYVINLEVVNCHMSKMGYQLAALLGSRL